MIVNDAAKGRRTSVVLAVVLGLLQLSVIPNVGILGGRANLALVFVACACLGGDARKAPASALPPASSTTSRARAPSGSWRFCSPSWAMSSPRPAGAAWPTTSAARS